jgi:hypothetical protein
MRSSLASSSLQFPNCWASCDVDRIRQKYGATIPDPLGRKTGFAATWVRVGSRETKLTRSGLTSTWFLRPMLTHVRGFPGSSTHHWSASCQLLRYYPIPLQQFVLGDQTSRVEDQMYQHSMPWVQRAAPLWPASAEALMNLHVRKSENRVLIAHH